MKTDYAHHIKYTSNKMNTNKYVPPHMRNPPTDTKNEPQKEESQLKQATTSSWGTKKTFASLAAEWDEQAKLAEIQKQQDEHEKQNEMVFSRKTVMPLPRFHNVRRFVEPEEEEEATEQVPQNSNPDDEGWVTVDRKKYRREKTIEEKLNRPVTPDEHDETVWNGDAPEEHETCWDQRY